MAADYTPIFFVALLLNAAVTLRSSQFYPILLAKLFPTGTTATTATPAADGDTNPLIATGNAAGTDQKKIHGNLLMKYLAVYLLAVLSDWLQGPYVYALYDAYGYSQHSIAVLFVAGFGSSMVFGSFVGGLADGCGRRKFVVLYAIIYAASCATKHFNDFKILMLGRLLGGIATSLLFSVFDAWLIRAHANAGVDKSFLATSFSSASYGNSVIAIIAGLIANRVAAMNTLSPAFGGPADDATAGGGRFLTGSGDAAAATAVEASTAGSAVDGTSVVYTGGYLMPFDVAFVALCLCGLGAAALWEENYGDQKADSSSSADAAGDGNDHQRRNDGVMDAWKRATATVFGNKEILLCGLISSLFEGSMYVFVFMWTPALTALTEGDASLPFGLIFSTFMVCCMAGSSTFSIAMEKRVKVETLAVVFLALATLLFLTITMAPSDSVAFIAMNIFEICVGMYFPTMGTMKSMIVPESSRAAIYNLYRIPLNFIVLVSLLTHLSATQSFALCTMMLGLATLLQYRLMTIRSTSQKTKAERSTGASVEAV